MYVGRFTETMQNKLIEFRSWYKQKHCEYGDIYPLDLDDEEWLEQFLIYLQLGE